MTGSRTGEVLGMQWSEVDTDARLWTCPANQMKAGEVHRVPLTDEMRQLAIIKPLRAMQSDYVFEGQKRHKPLSNMAMLMLLRRMKVESVTVHGFRSTFRDWAGGTPYRGAAHRHHRGRASAYSGVSVHLNCGIPGSILAVFVVLSETYSDQRAINSRRFSSRSDRA